VRRVREGFAAFCRQGRELGCAGKPMCHPKTIAAANDVVGPTEAEGAWSHKIIDAHATAAAAGKGVVVVDGKLIENLHAAEARRTLAMADAIAALSD